VASEFSEQWNFPNCAGALDGKRVLLQAPMNSGSLYYDYKQQFSVVLLALVDAHYRFLYIDVGANGRMSDAGVFSNSKLSGALENNDLKFPPASALPGTTTGAPFVVVADDAFPLKTYMLKPYPGRLYDDTNTRIFNYRLSRARRVVENAFGILVNRWRVLRGRMLVEPETAEKVVLAVCTLHNYLAKPKQSCSAYLPPGMADTVDPMNGLVTPGSWRTDTNLVENWQRLSVQGNRGHSTSAKQVRNLYRDYFTGVGSVAWQSSML